MTLLIFKVWFFITLLPGAAILIFQLNQYVHYLLYLGTVQVCFLGLLGTRFPATYVSLVIETLHKAGFLHTLFAMGGAIVVSGNILSSGIFSPEALSQILLTMGAAILPHAIAVMAGQALHMQHFNPDGEGKTELDGLVKLQEERKALLEQIIESLREETGLHDRIKAKLREQTESLSDLSESHSMLRENFQETLGNVTDKTNEALSGVQLTLQTLKRKVTDTNTHMEGTKEAAQELRTAAEQAAKSLNGLKDMEKLHGLFEDLIKAEIFRRAS